jgi:hypothetical protein
VEGAALAALQARAVVAADAEETRELRARVESQSKMLEVLSKVIAEGDEGDS